MSKKIILVIVLIAVVLVIGFAVNKTGNNLIKNVDMLNNGSQTPIITETNVVYFAGAKGYFARPATEAVYPGVVMIHENRGLRPEIKTMADQLAREGFMVLAVDLYNGKVMETQEEARAFSPTYNQQVGLQNLQAAVAYLKSKGAPRVASLGWCFGGAQSLRLAISGTPLDATVMYYGRVSTSTAELGNIKWPLLGIFAGNDTSISTSSVRQFEAVLNSLKIENDIYIYPGVGHAFANPSGMNYAPEQTKDAWQKTTDFLNKYLKSGITGNSNTNNATSSSQNNSGIIAKITTRINQTVGIMGLTIKPLEVLEDSRCPIDALCIQAGTVRVRTELVSGLGKANQIFELNKPVTTEAEEITLVRVDPSKKSTETVSNEQYEFYFEISKRNLNY